MVHRILSAIKYVVFSINRIFLYIFLAIINLVALSILISSLRFHTPTPTAHLHSITITSLNTKVDNLTATFDLIIIFDTLNCDNRIISYTDLETRVSWSGKDEIILAKTILPPFTQEADSVTMIRAELSMDGGLSNTSDVAVGIGMEREDTGSVQFGVSLLGLFSWRDDTSKEMRFDFDPVTVKFSPGSNNGTWKRVVSPPPLMHNFMRKYNVM